MQRRSTNHNKHSGLNSLQFIRIKDVWKRLGGGELRNGRGKAFWRGGDGPSISLDAERNLCFDHRDGRGGGILWLVEMVLGCSRREAWQWLQDEFGISAPKEQSATQVQQDAAMAADAAAWAHGMQIDLQQRYLNLLESINQPGRDPDAEDALWSQAEKWGKALGVLRGDDHATIWGWYQQHRRQKPDECLQRIREGREDLDHADKIGRLICKWLAKAREIGGAE